MDNIVWLRGDLSLLDELDEAEQHSAVQLLVHSGLKKNDTFHTIERLLQHGKPGGRRAAAMALVRYQGAQANALAWKLADDPDPRVQAAVVTQLRPRGIPGSLSKLIALVDSPHELVQQAARASLAEFNLEKYLAGFELLDDELRRSTGRLVRKVNPDCLLVLAEHFKSPSRTRRLRAIQAAVAMEAVAELEGPLAELLATDEDHVARVEAARALGECDTRLAREALLEALDDRSALVQDTAEESLRRLDPSFVRPPKPLERALP
jgi:HEAT repeat protein